MILKYPPAPDDLMHGDKLRKRYGFQENILFISVATAALIFYEERRFCTNDEFFENFFQKRRGSIAASRKDLSV